MYIDQYEANEWKLDMYGGDYTPEWECPECGYTGNPPTRTVNEEWGKVNYWECPECGYEDSIRRHG